jgi:hypothetical protein
LKKDFNLFQGSCLRGGKRTLEGYYAHEELRYVYRQHRKIHKSFRTRRKICHWLIKEQLQVFKEKQ